MFRNALDLNFWRNPIFAVRLIISKHAFHSQLFVYFEVNCDDAIFFNHPLILTKIYVIIHIRTTNISIYISNALVLDRFGFSKKYTFNRLFSHLTHLQRWINLIEFPLNDFVMEMNVSKNGTTKIVFFSTFSTEKKYTFIRTKAPKWNTLKRKNDWLFYWNDVCCCDFSIYWKSNSWFFVQFATLLVFCILQFIHGFINMSVCLCLCIYVCIVYLIDKFNPLVCHCCCCCQYRSWFLFHSNIFHMVLLAFVQFVNSIDLKCNRHLNDTTMEKI